VQSPGVLLRADGSFYQLATLANKTTSAILPNPVRHGNTEYGGVQVADCKLWPLLCTFTAKVATTKSLLLNKGIRWPKGVMQNNAYLVHESTHSSWEHVQCGDLCISDAPPGNKPL